MGERMREGRLMCLMWPRKEEERKRKADLCLSQQNMKKKAEG